MPFSRLLDWILGIAIVWGFLAMMHWLDQANPYLAN